MFGSKPPTPPPSGNQFVPSQPATFVAAIPPTEEKRPPTYKRFPAWAIAFTFPFTPGTPKRESQFSSPTAAVPSAGIRNRSKKGLPWTNVVKSFIQGNIGFELLLPSKLFLELAVIHLDEGRAAMRAGVRHGALAQVMHEV